MEDTIHYLQYFQDADRQYPSSALNHYESLVRKFLPGRAGVRIHHVGCGVGSFLERLNNYECFGSEARPKLLEIARIAVPWGRYELGDALHEPLFAEKFHGLVAFNVLHRSTNLTEAALSIRSQLLEGGLFAFSVPLNDRRVPWTKSQWLSWANENFRVVYSQDFLSLPLPFARHLHLPMPSILKRHATSLVVICKK
jgi:SAM-dependent methyltransferase